MADAKGYVDKVNVMKQDFGWEVPVELVPIPSGGIIYGPESTLHKKQNVKIKSMTAREEDILSSAALIKEGTVLDHLVEACVLDNINHKELIVGDRNAIMVAIRITGYGPEYPVRGYCDKCNHLNSFSVDLSALPIKRLKYEPVEPGRNIFKYQLPVTKKTVYFKLPTLIDERDRAIKDKRLRQYINSQIEPNVTSNLELCVLQVDDVKDKAKLKHFIANMPAFDSRSLRKHIRECEPGMDMTAGFTCENCGHENTSSIPITSEFFWPST